MRKLVLVCVLLLLSFTIVGLIGCGGDSDEELEESGKGPSVSYMVPKNGAADVPTTTAFLITFGSEIVAPSAANLTFTPGVSGTVSYNADTLTLMFKPSSDLNKYTDYSMTIADVTDMEGNAMSSVTINFSTAIADIGRPAIISSYPEDNQKDLGHDTEIILKFNEPVDRTKIRDGISFNPRVDVATEDWRLEWGYADDEEVTIFSPSGSDPFDLDEKYVLEILKGSVVDLSGNSMTSDYKVEFRTLKYPVEKAISTNIASLMVEPAWMFIVGKRGGTWIVVWGGTRPQGAPAGSSPSGTITASADGEIFDGVEAEATRQGERVTYSVTRGKGNRITFSSQNLGNKANSFKLMFASSASYLTFSLRPATPEYINIGSSAGHPSKSTFVLPNQ